MTREISRGVPQGSVLGPLLWNIAYDAVLRTPLPDGANLTCYADDTLVIANGRTWESCKERAEIALARLGESMNELGLSMATEKTEVIGFHKRNPPPEDLRLRVGEDEIALKQQMKYLGVYLDSYWNFHGHFQQLSTKLERTAGALSRLLPNLHGPQENVRRLYLGVLRSMALYGAQVWAEALGRSKQLRRKVNRLHQRMCTRVVKGYRTIPGEASELLARSPPLDLTAKACAREYEGRARRDGAFPGGNRLLRAILKQRTLQEWRQRLETARHGRRLIEATLPVFDGWMRRAHGATTYRMTQMLTGHGCFGKYLHRISKEETAACHHCPEEVDDADHTLLRCPAWEEDRRRLREAVGNQLDLPRIMAAMVRDRTAWDAMRAFCESTMTKKEEAERIREGTRAEQRRRRRR